MKTMLFIAFITLIGNSAKAQWYQVESNTTEHLNDIFFVDSLTGYCVGGGDTWGGPQGNGIVMETTDGGENWTTIFSQDSLSIQSVFVVDSAKHSKLYAFALKNGASYLVSTIVSSPPLNWSVTPISYRPFTPKLYNNAIYFADLSGSLKKLENDSISIVLNKGGLFDVNSNGLLWLNIDNNVPVVYFSNDYGSTIDTLNNLYNLPLNPNQFSDSKMFLLEDSYLIYVTYPGALISSLDSGQTWRHDDIYYGIPFSAMDKYNIYFIWGDKIIKTNYLISYIDTVHTFNFKFKYRNIKFINDRIGFIIGENGTILKTRNAGGGTVGINEGEELKKKLRSFQTL